MILGSKYLKNFKLKHCFKFIPMTFHNNFVGACCPVE